MNNCPKFRKQKHQDLTVLLKSQWGIFPGGINDIFGKYFIKSIFPCT